MSKICKCLLIERRATMSKIMYVIYIFTTVNIYYKKKLMLKTKKIWEEHTAMIFLSLLLFIS